MARERGGRGGRGAASPAATDAGDGPSIEHLIRAALFNGTTGRSIIVLDDVDAGTASLANVAGLRTVRSTDFAGGVVPQNAVTDEGILLPDIGIVIVSGVSDQIAALSTADGNSGIRTIIPETLVWLAPDGWAPGWFPAGDAARAAAGGPAGKSTDYWQGFHDALAQLLPGLAGGAPPAAAPGFRAGPLLVPAGAPVAAFTADTGAQTAAGTHP